MSVFRSDDAGENAYSPGGSGAWDPIARNPKDVGGRGGAIEPAQQAARVLAPLAPRADAMAPAWGPNQNGHITSSPMDMLASILRRKWTIIIVFVLVSAPLIAFIWTQVIPEYQARAEIRVRPIIPRLVFRTDDNGTIPFYDSFVNTQVSIMRSPTVLNRVLDQQDVKETQWYLGGPPSLTKRLLDHQIPPIEKLRESLSVRPRPRTEIIDVSFTDASAKDATTIVNAVLAQYTRYVADAVNKEDDLLYNQLLEKKTSLEDKIAGQEKLLARLQKQLGTALPEELVSTKRVHLDTLQMRLGQLQQGISILEWEIQQVAAYDGNDVPTAVAAEAERHRLYHEDSQWLALDRDLRTLEHQIENSIYGPNHPMMERFAKDKAFAQEQLERRETQLDEQWKNQSVTAVSVPVIVNDPNRPMYAEGPGSLQHQLARARMQEQDLLEELTTERKEFESLFETAQLLEAENGHLRHDRELYDAVRQRLDEKNMERNVAGSIEVLTSAFSPSQPSKDRRVVFTAMALAFGLGMGGGIAFLRASRNQTIRYARDIPHPAQTPFLGHIPLVQMHKAPGTSLCEELERNQFRLLESVRVLRTALLSRLSDQGGATVLVTSADEGTGKSSFTAVLGQSIAQSGRRVLLVDTDFHKMSLSRRFDLLDEPGLIETLKNKALERLPIFPTKTPGLDVLPVGKRGSEMPVYEEIANGAFKACIRRLRQDYGYDIILFDSAPILPVADATILAGQVDGTIIVERENVSQRSHVASALARLSATGGQLLGTVFVGSGGPQDYGRGYSYGYSCTRPSTGGSKS